MSEGRERTCAVCGEVVGVGPWLLLNRFGVGTSVNRCLSSIGGESGYLWEPNTNGVEEFISGVMLHWPECASLYIEGRMIETDHHFKGNA